MTCPSGIAGAPYRENYGSWMNALPQYIIQQNNTPNGGEVFVRLSPEEASEGKTISPSTSYDPYFNSANYMFNMLSSYVNNGKYSLLEEWSRERGISTPSLPDIFSAYSSVPDDNGIAGVLKDNGKTEIFSHVDIDKRMGDNARESRLTKDAVADYVLTEELIHTTQPSSWVREGDHYRAEFDVALKSADFYLWLADRLSPVNKSRAKDYLSLAAVSLFNKVQSIRRGYAPKQASSNNSYKEMVPYYRALVKEYERVAEKAGLKLDGTSLKKLALQSMAELEGISEASLEGLEELLTDGEDLEGDAANSDSLDSHLEE